jgi:hypothetical protein
MRQSGTGSALSATFRKYALNFPSGSVPGRVAAIGFSQGCQGIKELISGEQDADRLDFVYACDGMHGALDAAGAVTEASLAPWVKFGVRAATGEKMMVVTCSDIIPANRSKGVASTTETAERFIDLVRKGVGYKEIAPRMIPRALVGEPNWRPEPPVRAGNALIWPCWSNALSRTVHVMNWAVQKYTIIGNLIVVWFSGATLGTDEVIEYGKAQDVNHIFQDWWVKDQVLREVLACRWAAKCSSDLLNPENLTTNRAISSSPLPTMMMSPRFKSVLYAEPKPNVVLSGTNGLGTVASGGACVLEGTFSNLLSPSEMNSARTVGALKTAAIGVGAAAAGWWVLRTLLARRDS